MRLINANALWNDIGERVGKGEVSMDIIYEAIKAAPTVDAAPVLRPCVWNGRPARFHRWCDWSEIVEPSAMVGGHNGGELRYTVGIVEFEDGTIKRVLPQDIRFMDGAKMDAKEEEP